MQKNQTLGFDGRTVSCKEGKRLEKKLEAKEISFCYEEDIAGELWKERQKLPKHSVFLLPESICGQSAAGKLESVRKKMAEKHAGYLMLSKLDDLMWLLNIRGNDVECNPVALSYGLITMTEVFLFIQKEEVTEEFAAYAEKNKIVIKNYEEIGSFLRDYDFSAKVMLDEGNIELCTL